MKIALVTDAWQPQVNGVVRTWTETTRELLAMGHTLTVIHPGLFRTIKAPAYPEIRLALFAAPGVRRMLDREAPDAIHIATEGPLGWAARRHCLRRGLAFTTSYHTHYAHYLKVYFHIPRAWTFWGLRKFHAPARATLVPSPSVKVELEERGFRNIVVWGRGVDTRTFQPAPAFAFDLPRPVFIYVGRVAAEKNIEAFLKLDLPGSKVVVGDGPMKNALQRRHPEVHWAGYHFGAGLAARYAGADVMVFPSRTDTFGVVMLEANACGLPVAAFPVTGPRDAVVPGRTGELDEDLRAACMRALEISRADCRAHALTQSWRRCAQVVEDNLVFAKGGAPIHAHEVASTH
ncbi:MAG: glycosyltransferase family 1 protein [Planctomycetota bacterium]|nr:glycosyltransferase family 1 protein [Planctomycetota bacterium]